MDGLASQAVHHISDIVLLKKADRRNARRTCIKAGAGICERDAA